MGEGSAERLSVRAAGFDDTVETMRRVFGHVELQPATLGPTGMHLQSIRTDELMVVRWSLAGAGDAARAEEDESAILTGVVVRGAPLVRSGRDRIDAERPFLYPERVDSVLAEPDVVNLAVARRVVERHARAMTGLDDFVPRFTGLAPRDPALDPLWRDTVAYASRALDVLAGLDDRMLAHAALVDLVATTLLRTFPSTALDAESRRDLVGPRRAALRRAVQFIDDHVAEPIGVVEIAEASRLSVRGLHAAFRNHLGSTPMAYVRRARLEAARAQLREAASETTLAEVAARWGFHDERHLVASHRRAYGEPPPDPTAG